MSIIDDHLWHIIYLEKKFGIRLYSSIPKLAKKINSNIKEMTFKELERARIIGAKAMTLDGTVFLHPQDFKLLNEFHPDRLKGENILKDTSFTILKEIDAIVSMYHELMHSIVSKLADRDDKFKKIFYQSRKYYSNKYVFKKSESKRIKPNNAFLVANEAIANYVGARVESFLHTTFDLIMYKELYINKILHRDEYVKKLRSTANNHNSKLENFVFGYDIYNDEICFTDAKMPNFLIKYINDRFLSQELTFIFNRVITFRNILKPNK